MASTHTFDVGVSIDKAGRLMPSQVDAAASEGFNETRGHVEKW